MKQTEHPGTAPAAASDAVTACEPALAAAARQFPEDVQVAAETARKLRGGPPTPPRPEQEPWPPMRMLP